MDYREVTKEYNPALARAIKKTPKHLFDKATGKAFVYGRDEFWIEIGNLDDDQVYEWFTRGACGGLALAMHDLTGWELVGLHSDQIQIHGRTWMHFLVRHPSGLLVDIGGIHTDSSALGGWRGGNLRLEAATREQMVSAQLLGGDLDCYSEIERELIRDYARLLVAQVEAEMPEWSAARA